MNINTLHLVTLAFIYFIFLIELASVAQTLGHCTSNANVMSSIPSESIYWKEMKA